MKGQIYSAHSLSLSLSLYADSLTHHLASSKLINALINDEQALNTRAVCVAQMLAAGAACRLDAAKSDGQLRKVAAGSISRSSFPPAKRAPRAYFYGVFNPMVLVF